MNAARENVIGQVGQKASVWKALTFAKRSAYRLGNLFF